MEPGGGVRVGHGDGGDSAAKSPESNAVKGKNIPLK